MVNGITFSEQLTTSADFAHFQNTFLNHSNGVTKGCDVSHADGNVYVQKGYFVVYGRFVRVVGIETIPTPEVLSGQLYCKVVFEVDLSKTNTADKFNQGYFKVLQNESGYPAATQEDLDNDGTLYQMPWCQYVKKTSGTSEFRDLRPIMNLENIWSTVAGQNVAYKDEFDTYFASQKVVIEQMIAELEAEGFLLLDDARRIITVTIPASGWGQVAPYTQTVSVPGITVNDTPVVSQHFEDGITLDQAKAQQKAYGCLSKAVTADGSMLFTCYRKKPESNFYALVKGV